MSNKPKRRKPTIIDRKMDAERKELKRLRREHGGRIMPRYS